MASTYTLNFSDPSKTTYITVTGPVRNSTSTSLDLVGPGYVNYGPAIAQDFLKLLENFASPNPPVNPIEGQLWYDTSNPSRKILRVNNGSTTSARWPSANGIYQQADDPSIGYSQNVVEGDIWVDTGSTQLKIRYGDVWTLVGPSVSTGDAKTGNESITLVSTTGETYPVILNWVNGKVVEIISYNTFTPRTVIDGFPSLTPGINLTTRVAAKFNGLADRAKVLEISNGVYVQASEVLKNVWPVSQSQLLSGSLTIDSPQGLFVRKANQTNRQIQIYTTGSNQAVVNYGYSSGILKVGVYDRSYVKFNGVTGGVSINTSNNTGTLTVNGGAYINGEFTATGSLSIAGTAVIGNTVTLAGNLKVYGISEISTASTMTVGDIIPTNLTKSLGSADKPFESVYVKNIGSSTTYVKIYGSVTTATTLETARKLSITGVVRANLDAGEGLFDGTKNVTFTATAHRSLISDLVSTSTTTATQTLMVLDTINTSTSLNSISKSNFLADVYPNLISTGMIMAYATSATTATIAAGWLYCDGSEYISTSTTCTNLFNLIGYQYGTPIDPLKFKVPDLTTATVSGTNGFPIFYHIKR